MLTKLEELCSQLSWNKLVLETFLYVSPVTYSKSRDKCSLEYKPRKPMNLPLTYTAEDAQGSMKKMAYSENSEMHNTDKE